MQGAGNEATERSFLVGSTAEMRSRPEHDRAERVESQAHDDCFFVTEATHNLCCNRAEDEVATSEVGDLKTGRFKLGDTQYPLEMRVEHIEETVGETP